MVASSKFGLLIIKWHRATRNTYISILRVTGQTWESQYSSHLIVINHLTGCLVYANKVTPHVSLQSSLTYLWEYRHRLFLSFILSMHIQGLLNIYDEDFCENRYNVNPTYLQGVEIFEESFKGAGVGGARHDFLVKMGGESNP